MVHAIQIKTKLCQLVELMMERRDDLSFCQEMKFRYKFIRLSDYLACFIPALEMHQICVCLRNKMVEYLTDWVMGTSNQAADDDVKCLTR